jgi:aminopeptidase N
VAKFSESNYYIVQYQKSWFKVTTVFSFLILLITSTACKAQLHNDRTFTRQDTLRGTINPERSWWNVTKYEISVKPDYLQKTIEGKNIITFTAVANGNKMQIDLQEPMELVAAMDGQTKLTQVRDGNIYHVTFPNTINQGTKKSIELQFAGKPREAVRPPWDGGWIWKKDNLSRPWMSVACQGLGASVWYPCKDHQSDEPDSGAILSITVPDTLMAIGNGRLVDSSAANGLKTYTWKVVNPINNYNIIPSIGKYVNWKETFAGEKGPLDCSYWVLDYNLEKAKEQFKQAPEMLKCFEHWFGPYPFYEDSYKLVESPHLGMEHQSNVAYGNKFMNGYLGRDLSGTGWGEKWDFIIIHESAHEWFGNSITSNDLADMWVHEGFANYSETIFTTCKFGVQAGNEYVIGSRKGIKNDKPIIGPFGVNQEGSGDMYPKGGNLIHAIRQIVNDDEKFRMILRGLSSTFYHRTIDSKQLEAYISKQAGKDFSKVFDQYLRTVDIPMLEYKLHKGSIEFRWTNTIKGFNMPVKIDAGKELWLKPTTEWQTLSLADWFDGKTFRPDPNFYIQSKQVN